VKSTAQIFGLFGNHRHSDSVSRIWSIHECSETLLTRNLDWAVVVTMGPNQLRFQSLAQSSINATSWGNAVGLFIVQSNVKVSVSVWRNAWLQD